MSGTWGEAWAGLLTMGTASSFSFITRGITFHKAFATSAEDSVPRNVTPWPSLQGIYQVCCKDFLTVLDTEDPGFKLSKEG